MYILACDNRRAVAVRIDKKNYQVIAAHSWHINSNGYPAARIKGRLVRMHTLITGSEMIDHINRDKCDNRELNFRPATKSQNAANSKKREYATSQYKGVSWFASRGIWKAQICINNKRIFLGHFLVEEDAARAYNEAAIIHFGEFAVLNVLI